jgi:hypothetical protein
MCPHVRARGGERARAGEINARKGIERALLERDNEKNGHYVSLSEV